MQVSHSFALGIAACACAVALTSAAVEPQNVTARPTRPLDQRVMLRNARLRNQTAGAPARGHIRTLIERITVDDVTEFVTHLSGEAALSFQNSRLSTGTGPGHPFGIEHAISYVQTKMNGFGFDVSLENYRAGYAPNVVSCRRGTAQPNEYVILGAHLDDIPSVGRAPGANDDGSGSAALLAIAKAILEDGARFRKTLCLEHYTGEEQGLLGSRAQAEARAGRGEDVIAQIQQDMTAVRLSGDELGLSFVNDERAIDLDMTIAVENIARTYADPELQLHVGTLSGASCCSDHQSYKESGYPSVGILEPRGYTGDPKYHDIGDVVDRAEYSTEQLALTARVALAAAGILAELEEL